MKLKMVSESLFNEVLLPNEQKSLTRIFQSPNLDEKTAEPEMSPIDVDIPESSSVLSVPKSHDVDEIIINKSLENVKNSFNNSKDDFEYMTSDIELSIDDVEDKDSVSENDNKQTNVCKTDLKINGLSSKNDVDSIETVDNDLKTTASLVGREFQQDDFDSSDSLDVENITRLNKSETNPIHCEDNSTTAKPSYVDVEDHLQGILYHAETFQKTISNMLPESENNDHLDTTEMKEKHSQSCNENENTAKLCSQVISEICNKIVNESTNKIYTSIADNERKTSPLPIAITEPLNKISIGKVDSSDSASAETELVESKQSTEVVHDVLPVRCESAVPNSPMMLESNAPSELIENSKTISVMDETSSATTDEQFSVYQNEILLKNENIDKVQLCPLLPEVSSQPSSEELLQSLVEAQTLVVEKPGSMQNQEVTLKSSEIEESQEMMESNDCVQNIKSVEDAEKTQESVENQKLIEKSSIFESKVNIQNDTLLPEVEVSKSLDIEHSNEVSIKVPVKDFPSTAMEIDPSQDKENESETRIIDTPVDVSDEEDCNVLQCNEPQSVESAELQIIDLAEPEVVELEDIEESAGKNDVSEAICLDLNRRSSHSSTILENELNSISNENNVEGEIQKFSDKFSSSETMEVDIHSEKFSAITDSENRKRKLESEHQNCNIEEKRHKIDEETCIKNTSVSNDTRKKGQMNIARKHTSSMNISKTVKEIEKKIVDEMSANHEQDKSREATPSPDVIDEYHLIVSEDKNSNAVEENESLVDDLEKIKLNTSVLSKESLKSIFQVMRDKLTRRQLEEIVIQKCCEMISDSSEIASLKRQVNELQQAELYRKQKILNLEKQIHQLKAVCQRYLDQVKDPKNENKVVPLRITRSVGLQVAIESVPNVCSSDSSSSQKNDDRLKKLLTSPTNSGKKQEVISSPGKSTDSKSNNGQNESNGRISSPLITSPTPLSGRNVSMKKTTASTETVIDLTDKDDKNESEVQTTTKTLLTNMNGSVLTYVPIKMNQDQNKQILKPGTQLVVNGKLVTVQGKPFSYQNANSHPAPVPPTPSVIVTAGTKPLPAKPILRIAKSGNGIMLSWNMPANVSYATITKYQLYAYQETSNVPPSVDLWKIVGDVQALALPMACTLTQFVEGYRYHFIVRAVDIHGRMGPFSYAESISI